MAANRQPPWHDEADAVALPDGYPWSPQERWAWARILRGFVADLSDYAGPPEKFGTWAEWFRGADDGAGFEANVQGEDGELTVWPDHRVLSNVFLRLVLFHEPWCTAPNQPRVRIASARIDEKLLWSADRYRGELWLDRCRFAQDVEWAGLKIDGTFSLSGARFQGAFGADRLETQGSFFCSGAVFAGEKEARIPGARIASNASFTGATLRGGLNAEGAEIGGDLLCRDQFHCLGPVRILGARIGCDLSFSNATLEGPVRADGIVINGALFCRDTVAHQEVRMLGGRIGGIATFVGAQLHGGVQGDSLEVGRDLFLRDVRRLGDSVFVGARVGGDVQLSDSYIDGEVNLTGARVAGELQTSQHAGSSPRWSDKARLVLRNARLGALAGSVESFPKPIKGAVARMDLSGMTYDRLGGLGAQTAGSLAGASVRQLKDWLAAGHAPKEFTPGPYRTLSSALVEAGQAREANHVLYAMRALDAQCERSWFRKVRLFFSDLFIGYGHKSWRAFAWFLALVTGYAVYGLSLSGQTAFLPTWGGVDNVLQWLGFSLGNAVPVVSLDKAHETFLASAFGGGDPLKVPARLAWTFYWQKIFGFVILSYLAAGVSGLASRQRE